MLKTVRRLLMTDPERNYPIRIAAGPLSGLEGTLLRMKPGGRAVVRVSAGTSQVLVELDSAMFVPTPHRTPLRTDGHPERDLRR